MSKKKQEEKVKFKKHKILGKDDFSSIEKEIKKESRNEEIQDDLIEIYSNDKGEISNLSEIKVKKKRPFLVRLFLFLLLLTFIGVPLYLAFNYFYNEQNSSSFALNVNISAPDKIVLGEPFFYEIDYANSSSYNLKNIELEMLYPENFVFLESYPNSSFSNNLWNIDSLDSGDGSKIKIKGFIINKEGLNNLASLKAGYEISGFSSYFKKEFFYSLTISSIPFTINLDFSPTILLGEEYIMNFSLKNFHFLKEKMILSLDSSENIDFSFLIKESDKKLKIEELSKNIFAISRLEDVSVDDNSNDYNLYLKYKSLNKETDKENIRWDLKYIDEDGKEFHFYERDFSIDLIKSDLYLNLLINNNNSDKPVNFGDKLEYSIEYSNKGDKDMKDVVLMLVLDSDFLDWSSFDDQNNGKISRKTISWTSREIPALKELQPEQEGVLNFSINISDFKNINFGQELQVKSYAQFSIGNVEDFIEDNVRVSDNRSNTIINRINTNLSFNEELKYFDDNNIPVGSGPLPPKVNEKSTFRVYWTIKNSLHELKDLKIELFLPTYISWEDKYNIPAGELFYDLVDHKIVWSLSRLPLGIDELKINFDISIMPTDFEYNKILILSPGSSLEAFDIENNSLIYKKTNIKTTKLEDDSIAGLSSDGIIK